MSNTKEKTFECSDCGNDISDTDEFCPDCGALFEESVLCSVHNNLYEANGDSKGHIVNEIKLMVPSQEVIAEEEILRKLKLIN